MTSPVRIAFLLLLAVHAPLPNAAAAGDIFDEFAEFEQTTPAVRDPLEPYNRFMFGVNDRLYFWVIKPVARGYKAVVPLSARRAVQHCAENLAFPVRFVNNGLQGRFRAARIELGRFCINSTLGLAGLFDPAQDWFDLRPHDEDLGQTLGRYGVGAGWPVVLPLLGPSSTRDLAGLLADGFLHPLNYLRPAGLALGVRAAEKENYVSLHLGEYEALRESALDPYTFFRDAYRQNRTRRIEE